MNIFKACENYRTISNSAENCAVWIHVLQCSDSAWISTFQFDLLTNLFIVSAEQIQEVNGWLGEEHMTSDQGEMVEQILTLRLN